MRKSFNFRRLLLLCATVFLCSCGGLLDSQKPVEKIYQLTPYIDTSSEAKTDMRPSLVLALTVVPGLDSDRIMTINPDAELNHFSGARWPDHLPEMMESLLRRSLSSSGQFSRVSVQKNAGLDGCRLDLEVQQFVTHVDRNTAASEVHLQIAGYFNCADLGRSLVLEERVAVDSNALPAIVRAYQQGTDRLSNTLIKRLQAD